jgi:hypothetical protein
MLDTSGGIGVGVGVDVGVGVGDGVNVGEGMTVGVGVKVEIGTTGAQDARKTRKRLAANRTYFWGRYLYDMAI